MSTKISLALFFIFSILTFAGAGYVLARQGSANAGYACIPMIFTMIFAGMYKKSKQKP